MSSDRGRGGPRRPAGAAGRQANRASRDARGGASREARGGALGETRGGVKDGGEPAGGRARANRETQGGASRDARGGARASRDARARAQGETQGGVKDSGEPTGAQASVSRDPRAGAQGEARGGAKGRGERAGGRARASRDARASVRGEARGGVSREVRGGGGWAVAGVLVLLLAAVLGAARPAVAAPAPQRQLKQQTGQRIAAALKHSPVYVDAAYASAVPAVRQARLAARIRASGLPVEVALVPLVKGDAFDGDPSVLAGVLHDRLGQRELILITMDRWSDMLDGFEWPDDRHQARDAVDAVGFLPEMKNAGLADRVAKAVDLIAAGDGSRVYKQATADLGGPKATASAPATGANRASRGGSSALPVALAVVGAVLVGAVGGLLLVRRGRRRRSPFAFPEAVFAAEAAVDEAGLRRRAEAEMIALGESLDAADPASAGPRLRRALDAYAAAGTVFDGARGVPDLAGVLALVAEGRAAVEGRSDEALPLCFFDPLHGAAERRVAWRPLGRRDTLHVAACRACAQAVAARRAPEVLTDLAPDGRRVPYFEVPAAHSIWAATGYGSLLPPTADAADTLPARVLRGDFTRARDPR